MMARQQQEGDVASNEATDCHPPHLQRQRDSLLSRSDFIRSTVVIAGVTAMVASSAMATASPLSSPSSSSVEEAQEASEGTVGTHSHDASAAHAATLGQSLLNHTSH